MKKRINLTLLVLIVLLSSPNLFAVTVTGTVLYYGEEGRYINDVTVNLLQKNNKIVGSDVSAENGTYTIDVPPGKYTLRCETNIPGREPTFYDAVLVFLHVAYDYPLSNMQNLASDVNSNKKVNWDDYNHIVNRILKGTPFPAGDWQFEELDITVTGLKAKDGVPVGGTCSGDIGGAFIPNNNSKPALLLAQAGEINIEAGEPFSTSIITNTSISFTGAGIIINYPAELLNIESVEFKGVGYEYNILNGQIRFMWGDPNTVPITFSQGETFVTIHGTATPAFAPGMIATLGLDGNTSLINTSNKEITNLSFASPVLKPGKPELKINNYPNPFTASTKLTVYTPIAGNAILEIYNAAGVMVMNIQTGKMEAGYREINLNTSKLAKGYYICKLRIQSADSEISSTRRLIKAE